MGQLLLFDGYTLIADIDITDCFSVRLGSALGVGILVSEGAAENIDSGIYETYKVSTS